MAYATVEDVEVRFGRTLTPGETAQVEAWIGDLEADVLERIPDIDALILTGRPSARTVTRVISGAIVRKLHNPEGLRSTTTSIDDYSTTKTVDQENSSGRLWLTTEDWALLLPGTGGDAFSIRPYGAPGFVAGPEVWL